LNTDLNDSSKKKQVTVYNVSRPVEFSGNQPYWYKLAKLITRNRYKNTKS